MHFEFRYWVFGFILIAACASVTVTRFNSFSIKKDQVFKKGPDFELKGDVYIPKTAGLKPAVIVVHGGGWSSRSGDMHEICDDLAGTGFVVFNITYRLAPAALYPKAVEDVRDAISFFKNHALDYEVDPEMISGWGYSAGAHLILMAGLDPASHLKSIVAGGTPSDFPFWPNSPIITKFIGHPYLEAKETWEEASPINHVRPNSPPVFLYHGHNDHLVEVEQMYRMRDALRAKNVEVQTYEVPILGHIFVYLFSTSSIKQGIAFIKLHDHLI